MKCSSPQSTYIIASSAQGISEGRTPPQSACLFKNSAARSAGGLDGSAVGGGTRSGRAKVSHRRGSSGQERESRSTVARAKRRCSQSGGRGGTTSKPKKQVGQRA